MKKILFVIILFLLSINNVNAEACDAYDIKRLKEIAEGVELTYELKEPYESNEMMIYDENVIRITGLTDELYIYDETNEVRYKKADEINGVIEYTSNMNGNIKFLIYSTYCPNKIRSLSIELPIYNHYRQTEECKNINYNIEYCKEYLTEYINDEKFFSSYNKYLETLEKDEENNSVYKYIIIGFVCFVVVFLIFNIIKKRKEQLI